MRFGVRDLQDLYADLQRMIRPGKQCRRAALGILRGRKPKPKTLNH